MHRGNDMGIERRQTRKRTRINEFIIVLWYQWFKDPIIIRSPDMLFENHKSLGAKIESELWWCKEKTRTMNSQLNSTACKISLKQFQAKNTFVWCSRKILPLFKEILSCKSSAFSLISVSLQHLFECKVPKITKQCRSEMVFEVLRF